MCFCSALSSMRALAGSCVYPVQWRGGADGWVSLDVFARHAVLPFFFFLSLFPGPEHNGKPLILYCWAAELDQKIHRGLGSVPPASPSPIFASSQHRRRSPLCGSTFGNGSETRWLGLAQRPPAAGDGVPSVSRQDQ